LHILNNNTTYTCTRGRVRKKSIINFRHSKKNYAFFRACINQMIFKIVNNI